MGYNWEAVCNPNQEVGERFFKTNLKSNVKLFFICKDFKNVVMK